MQATPGHDDPDGLDRRGGREHPTRKRRTSVDGRDAAAAEMPQIVYGELRRRAASRLDRERLDPTAQPAAVVLDTSDSTLERDGRVARSLLHQAVSDAD